MEKKWPSTVAVSNKHAAYNGPFNLRIRKHYASSYSYIQEHQFYAYTHTYQPIKQLRKISCTQAMLQKFNPYKENLVCVQYAVHSA